MTPYFNQGTLYLKGPYFEHDRGTSLPFLIWWLPGSCVLITSEKSRKSRQINALALILISLMSSFIRHTSASLICPISLSANNHLLTDNYMNLMSSNNFYVHYCLFSIRWTSFCNLFFIMAYVIIVSLNSCFLNSMTKWWNHSVKRYIDMRS